MKKYSIFSVRACQVMFLAACIAPLSYSKSEDTARGEASKLLNGTWRITDVTVDGVNQSDLFNGFTLTFASGVYTSGNGDPVWPAAGNWIFSNRTGRTITREDGIEITINSISQANLTLTLQWDQTSLGGGRISSIRGNHVFELHR